MKARRMKSWKCSELEGWRGEAESQQTLLAGDCSPLLKDSGLREWCLRHLSRRPSLLCKAHPYRNSPGALAAFVLCHSCGPNRVLDCSLGKYFGGTYCIHCLLMESEFSCLFAGTIFAKFGLGTKYSVSSQGRTSQKKYMSILGKKSKEKRCMSIKEEQALGDAEPWSSRPAK